VEFAIAKDVAFDRGCWFKPDGPFGVPGWFLEATIVNDLSVSRWSVVQLYYGRK
jgi:hypothetical protein